MKRSACVFGMFIGVAMKPISVRIGVALLAFFLGVVASTIRSRIFAGSHESASSPASSRDEQWHRLYEAAGMSGDGAIRYLVDNRLLCTNMAGVPDAWPVEIKYTQWCRRADGSLRPLFINDTSEYGSYYRRITSSHSTWTRENLDFVRTISTGNKAKEYVTTHKWPF
jgi:hypothetical protein